MQCCTIWLSSSQRRFQPRIKIKLHKREREHCSVGQQYMQGDDDRLWRRLIAKQLFATEAVLTHWRRELGLENVMLTIKVMMMSGWLSWIFGWLSFIARSPIRTINNFYCYFQSHDNKIIFKTWLTVYEKKIDILSQLLTKQKYETTQRSDKAKQGHCRIAKSGKIPSSIFLMSLCARHSLTFAWLGLRPDT